MRPYKIAVLRNSGHPWWGEKRPGFDTMTITASTNEVLSRLIEIAEKKYWRVYLIGKSPTMPDVDGSITVPAAVLYKPCDINEPWEDIAGRRDEGHPGFDRRDKLASVFVSYV